jgi:hypothetical protein
MQLDHARRIPRARQLLHILAIAAWMQLPAAAFAVPTVITEFFNSTLRHYVLITSPAEVAAIEAGAAGPGWQKTGRTIYAHTDPNDAPGLVPVCRFYGSITPGPNSHFFTADPDECAAVKTDPGWHYEEIAFYVTLPAGGECDADRLPVWRAYNNGFKPQQGINDGNHRFATDHAITRRLADFGWNDEGIVFCALATTPFVPYVFGISAAPVLLIPGATRSVFFSLDARNGFSGDVTLTATGLPAGVSAQFEPPTVTLGTKPASVALRLTATGSAPVTADYTNVTINGTAAGGNAFSGFVLGVGAADDPLNVQALAVAAVEEKSHALRVQGLKGLPYVQGIAEFMSTHPGYVSAGSDATMIVAWGKFKDGTLHVVTDNLERPTADSILSQAMASTARRVAAKAGGEIPGQTKARLLHVFGSNFEGQKPISDMSGFLSSKGWSVRSNAGADVTSLMGVQGDGFFYLNTHGTVVPPPDSSEPDGMHLVWTATLADPDYDRFFAIDRLTLRLVKLTENNFLEPPGAVPLQETRYAITYRFVRDYMKFEDSSVVFMNACWSGQTTNPATTKFIKAFHDAGAGVYLSWTHKVDWTAAFRSAPYVVDRMVGANLLATNEAPKESPPQRAFTYDLVLQDLARIGFDYAKEIYPPATVRAKLLPHPNPGLKFPSILAPSIRFARVNEYDGELVLTGEFGEQVPKVTVGGKRLTVKPGNTASEITAVLPPTGPGSNGDVVVEVRGVKSNARQLTEWWVPFSYRWVDVIGVPGLLLEGDTTLRFRADLAGYRLQPHETPHFTSLGGPPINDTALRLTGSGSSVSGNCTLTLSGSASYRTPAAPPTPDGLVLANFIEFYPEPKAASMGLSFGASSGSPHMVTISGGPNCTGTFPVPPVAGLLEGTVQFPSGQDPSRPRVPLPAMNFTLDANWGFPATLHIDLSAGGEIRMTTEAATVISPPRDADNSGK